MTCTESPCGVARVSSLAYSLASACTPAQHRRCGLVPWAASFGCPSIQFCGTKGVLEPVVPTAKRIAHAVMPASAIREQTFRHVGESYAIRPNFRHRSVNCLRFVFVHRHHCRCAAVHAFQDRAEPRREFMRAGCPVNHAVSSLKVRRLCAVAAIRLLRRSIVRILTLPSLSRKVNSLTYRPRCFGLTL